MRINFKFDIDQTVYATNPGRGQSVATNEPLVISEAYVRLNGNRDIDGITYIKFYEVIRPNGERMTFQEGELTASLMEWWKDKLYYAQMDVRSIKEKIERLKSKE